MPRHLAFGRLIPRKGGASQGCSVLQRQASGGPLCGVWLCVRASQLFVLTLFFPVRKFSYPNSSTGLQSLKLVHSYRFPRNPCRASLILSQITQGWITWATPAQPLFPGSVQESSPCFPGSWKMFNCPSLQVQVIWSRPYRVQMRWRFRSGFLAIPACLWDLLWAWGLP